MLRSARDGSRGALLLVLAALGLGAPVTYAAQDEHAWRDLESRIQYGYYTEDVSALRHLAESVDGEPHDKLRSYYAGLLDWRLALLAAQAVPAAGSDPAQLAQRCVNEADDALAAEADFAEALALRSACLAAPLESGLSHGNSAANRARKDLNRARQLAAGNPRVLLVDAMSDYELGSDKGGNKERALPKFREAVAAFEAERRDNEHLPGWGAAEAWLFLARDLFDHGDPVASRDALEHALLIAPEYAQAHRLLLRITTG